MYQEKYAVLTTKVMLMKEAKTYLVGNTPFAPQSNLVAKSVVLSDDSQAGPFPIGFNFCFFW
jgi:hypothetical protein